MTRSRITYKAFYFLPILIVIVVAFSIWRVNQLAQNRWDNITRRGNLRVGIDPGWQPFSFYNDAGWVGIDADICREIALRLNVQVQVVPVGYDALYDALHLGKVDIVMSALTEDASRMQDYAYTASYFDAGLQLVVSQTSGIHAIDDLSNHSVAAALGSDADRLARYWERRLVNVRRVAVQSEADGLTQVQAGNVNAVIVSAVMAQRLKNVNNRLLFIDLNPHPYVIGMRQDNQVLLTRLNMVLNGMKADGTLERIINRWLH